jgi:hypothetical protein
LTMQVLQMAASRCDLDADGPLVRIMANRLEREFYHTAADLRSLPAAGWERFALPPPMESAARALLGGQMLRRLGQSLGSDLRRTAEAPTCLGMPQNCQIWAGLIQKRPAVGDSPGWSASPAKRTVQSGLQSDSPQSLAAAAAAAALPYDLLPCRALCGCAVQQLMTARQVCQGWRDAVDGRSDLWRLASFHTCFVDDFEPLRGAFLSADAVFAPHGDNASGDRASAAAVQTRTRNSQG